MKTDEIKKRVENTIKAHGEILAAYLYGSFASGSPVEESDIDIGLLLRADYTPEPLYEARISRELDKALGREVEARVLNHKNLIFLHQVLKHSKPLFSRDDKERIRFETETYSKYLDFKPFCEDYNQIRRERLLQ